MRRYVPRPKQDRRYFRNTARKTKAINVVPTSARGGVIM